MYGQYTEMQSTNKNDFECFARTGVNTPETILANDVQEVSGTTTVLLPGSVLRFNNPLKTDLALKADGLYCWRVSTRHTNAQRR